MAKRHEQVVAQGSAASCMRRMNDRAVPCSQAKRPMVLALQLCLHLELHAQCDGSHHAWRLAAGLQARPANLGLAEARAGAAALARLSAAIIVAHDAEAFWKVLLRDVAECAVLLAPPETKRGATFEETLMRAIPNRAGATRLIAARRKTMSSVDAAPQRVEAWDGSAPKEVAMGRPLAARVD